MFPHRFDFIVGERKAAGGRYWIRSQKFGEAPVYYIHDSNKCGTPFLKLFPWAVYSPPPRGNNRDSESEVSFMQENNQNNTQNKSRSNAQNKSNQNAQNKKSNQAQNKSKNQEQF